MLKYDKNRKENRTDSSLTVIIAGGQMLLVLIGLIGVSVELFRDNGWLKQALSAIMDTSNSTLIMSLPVGLLVFLVGKSWMDSHGERKSSSLIADAMLYVMMLVGAWFLFRFVTEGGL